MNQKEIDHYERIERQEKIKDIVSTVFITIFLIAGFGLLISTTVSQLSNGMPFDTKIEAVFLFSFVALGALSVLLAKIVNP